MLFVPTGQAPHKRIIDDPGAELRLAMTRLAATDDERFVVSTLEIERDGPSYTFETLEQLAEQGDDSLVFVMGADAAVGLESWRNPERVVELARLAIARRAGISEADQLVVFDRWARLSTPRRNGVGLGLAIVKAIAEAHDGTVDVLSRPGHGSTFEIRLPVFHETAPARVLESDLVDEHTSESDDASEADVIS